MAKSQLMNIAILSDNQQMQESLHQIITSGSKISRYLTYRDETWLAKLKNRFSPQILVLVSMTESDVKGLNNITALRKQMPFANFIVFSNPKISIPVQQYFLFGCIGLITADTPAKTIERMLLDFVLKDIPPLSPVYLRDIVMHFSGEFNMIRGAEFLSSVQKKIATQLVKGLSYHEISMVLQMNLNNVRYHIKQVYQKLGVNKRIHLIPYFEAGTLGNE